jgi:hypothetical protein
MLICNKVSIRYLTIYAKADNVKVLCLGNNSTDTHEQTTRLAHQSNHVNMGLITTNTIINDDGYYHTSVFDLSSAEIKELLVQFNKLIMLDQPIDQWTHPDAFYLTAKIVDDAEDLILVSRLVETSHINFFEEFVEKNKSFCIFPFIELLVNNGNTTVCCRSNTPITKINEITDWATDSNYKEIREKMLTGELVPEHCSSCYNYESKGIKSARQQETVEWANRLGLKTLDDLLFLPVMQSPSYYEVRPSNICNLQCRMCGPASSNLIEKEYTLLGWHDPKNKIDYTGFEFIKFDNLKKLYVAGGEPTAMIELYDFMQFCIDQNRTDFEFIINTNANKINKKFLELSDNFSNLQFIISIDGFMRINDYVRWLSDWDTIIENSKRLSINHKISFNITVSLYTISRLNQLLEFIDVNFPKMIVHCTIAESQNDILSPYNYPNWEEIAINLSGIKHLNCYKNDRLLQSFIDGMIDANPKKDSNKLKQFFEFNDMLDRSRNVKLVDYISELDKFRTWC